MNLQLLSLALEKANVCRLVRGVTLVLLGSKMVLSLLLQVGERPLQKLAGIIVSSKSKINARPFLRTLECL